MFILVRTIIITWAGAAVGEADGGAQEKAGEVEVGEEVADGE